MSSLRRKVFLAATAALALFAACAGLTLRELRLWSDTVEYFLRDNQRALLDGQLQAGLMRAVGETVSYLVTGNDGYRREAEEALGRARAILSTLTEIARESESHNPDEPAHHTLLERQATIYAKMAYDINIATTLAGPSRAPVEDLLRVLYSNEGEADKLWNDVRQHHEAEREENEKLILKHERRVIMLVVANVLVLGFWILALIVFVSRSLVRPLRDLAETTSAVASGDFSPRVAVTSKDEIGQLQGTVNYMVRELDAQREALTQRTAELARMVESLSQARDAADVANRTKSQFLANVSHEIRTPMNGIFVTLDMLRETALDEEQKRYIQLAQSSAQNLLRLINDVLDFSKIEAGRLELEQIGFDLHGLLTQVVALQAKRASAKGLLLDLKVAPEVPRAVRGDPLRLGQVLGNLLDNAIKFTQQGCVTIAVAPSGAKPGDLARMLRAPAVLPHHPVELRFEVRDTGVGLAPEAWAKVFEPFLQADGSTTRKFGGTGLGLAIAKQLVHMMGGRIGVDSQPGEGSTFWFTACLEADDQTPEIVASKRQDEDAVLPSGGRVLLVEDNAENRELVGAMLAAMGMRVQVAEDGREAVAMAASARYDLILMDCHMPEMDGFEATRCIRLAEAGAGRVPIVALTANVIDNQRERCLAAGMDDFLAKPFTRSQLEEIIRRWVATTV